jgi:hypothetical protein
MMSDSEIEILREALAEADQYIGCEDRLCRFRLRGQGVTTKEGCRCLLGLGARVSLARLYKTCKMIVGEP